MALRQEIDGPQAKQLEFIPCGQKLHNSRRLSPAQIRDERPRISHSQSQGGLPDHKLEVKRRMMSRLPIGLFARIYLDLEMLTHVGNYPRIYQLLTGTGQIKMIGQRKPRINVP